MSDDELQRHIASQEWYHTIELRPGVTTPGWFDTRQVAAMLPFPALGGTRCLDVGTFDGYWALHMESLGAREVVAIDVLDPEKWDWPVLHDESVVADIARRKRDGDGFTVVTAALGSGVRRLELSVYDLDAADVGQFDFAYVGSLLLHLRDPVLALSRVRDVLTPGGTLLLVDAVDWELTLRHPRAPVARLDGLGRPWWWRPNMAGLQRLVEAAGFEVVGGPKRFRMPPGPGHTRPPRRALPRALRSAAGRQEAIEGLLGDPHAWVTARVPS